MANSAVDICNHALTLIGESRITSLTDATNQARACNLVYENLRDEVLSAYNWREAKARVLLSAVLDAPAFEYAYKYLLPANPYCLRPIELYESSEKWEINGRYLLTNESSPKLIYIARITAVTDYSPELVSCLAARIATDIAMPLAGSKSLAEAMHQVYQMRLPQLVATNNMGGGTPKQWSLDAENWADARRT